MRPFSSLARLVRSKWWQRTRPVLDEHFDRPLASSRAPLTQPMRLEALEDRLLLSGNAANAGQVFEFSSLGGNASQKLYLRQSPDLTLIQGQRDSTSGAWTTLVNLSTLPTGATAVIDTATIASAFSLNDNEVPGQFVVYSSITTLGRSLTISSRGGIEVGENLSINTSSVTTFSQESGFVPTGPAGNLTLEAINPSGALFSDSTPIIELKKGASLLASVGTIQGDITLRVETRQISLNVPLLTNFGVDTQTSTINLGEDVTIRGKDVTLRAYSGDENPLDAVNKALNNHPQMGGLLKSLLNVATDYLSLPISIQLKNPSAEVSLGKNSKIISQGTTRVTSEAIGDATGQAIYGFDTFQPIGAAFAFNWAAPSSRTIVDTGASIQAGGEVELTASTTSISAGTARVTQNLGAGYLEKISGIIAPYSVRKGQEQAKQPIYNTNPDRIQVSAVVAVSKPSATVTVEQGAEILATNQVTVHALGKSTNRQIVETASYFDGRAGVTLGFGVTQAEAKTTVNGKITVTSPPASTPAQTFNPFLAVNFAASTLTFTTDHAWQTGDSLIYSTSGEAIPGLVKDELYYAIRVDARTIQLATSKERALAGQPITFGTYPTLQKGTLQLPLTRVNETDNAVEFEFATGLIAGDQVTYHAVPGAAIAGLIDGRSYLLVAMNNPASPNSFQLRDTTTNQIVQLRSSPTFTWNGKNVFFNIGRTVNTIDLRQRSFTPAVTGNTIDLGFAHGFVTGTKLTYFNAGATDTNIGGLTEGATYYAVVDPANPTRLQLASDEAGTNVIPLTSAGSGAGHALYAAVASGDALTYSGALGLKINGLTEGTTYYAIVNPHDPGILRLTTSQADALAAAAAGQATYDEAQEVIHDTLYQIAYDDWLYEHPGDTTRAAQEGEKAGDDAVAAVMAERPELPRLWFAAGLASARRADASVIALNFTVQSDVLSGTAHTLTPSVRGISILARLVTSDAGATRSGTGGEPTLRDLLTNSETIVAMPNILKNLASAGNVTKAIDDNLSTNVDRPSVSVAGSFLVHAVQNVVRVNIGGTAVLQTHGDLSIRAELIQKTNRSVEATVSKPDDAESTNAAALAVGFGLYSNEASVTIADGAQLDASRATSITSEVRYPFLFPTTAEDAESVFTTDLVKSAGNLVNGKLGLNRFLFNAWTRTSVDAPSSETSIAGSLTAPILINRSLVTIGDVKINQQSAYRSNTQSLLVHAATSVVLVDMTGNFVLDLSPEGLRRLAQEGRSPINFGLTGDNGLGASFYIAVGTNTTSATLGGGSQVFVSDVDRGMRVLANTTVVNVSLAATTGKAESDGFAGTFSASIFINRTTAQIEGGAVIQSTFLDVEAHDSTVQVNLAGAFQLSSGKGFGFTVTTNVLDRETLAILGANPKKNETAAASSITLSRDLNISARNTGAMVAISVAASVIAPQAVTQSNVGSTGTSAVQNAGNVANNASRQGGSSVVTNATSQVGSQYGIGVSADVALNLVTNDTAYAIINEVEADISSDPTRRNIRAEDVSVTATNRTGIGAIAGAVAMSVSADTAGTSAGAGSLTVNTIVGDTQASVTGVRMDARTLNVEATRLGVITTLTAALAATTSASGDGVGGSVSINVITDNLKAYLTNSHIVLTGDLTVRSRNETLIVAVAGGVGYGGKAGVGFAIAVNVITGDNRAYIDRCVINQSAGSLTLTATTDNPGPDSNSDSDVRIVALTGTVGLGTNGSGGAGMVSVNVIDGTTEAYLRDTTYTCTSSEALLRGMLVQATDSSWIVTLGFAVGGSANSNSVGAALSVNVIDNDTRAFLENSTVAYPGDVSILAINNATIGAATVGVAGSSGGNSVAGSFSVNVVTNTTEAYITSTGTRKTITAGGDVEVKATDSSLIVGIAGGIGISVSGGGAVGGAININVVDNTTRAYLDGAELLAVSPGSTLTIQASESAQIIGVTVGVAGAAQGTAVSGSVALNIVSNETYAGLRNDARAVVGGDIQVVASDSARLVVITGAIAASFGSSAVGVSVSVNTVTNRTRATIEGSSVQSLNGSVELTAGWDAPSVALPTAITVAPGDDQTTSTTIDLPTPREELQQNQVVAVSVSGGLANNTAAAGALPVNVISNEFVAQIKDSTVTAAGDIEIQVVDRASIGNGALGAAVGQNAGGATVGSSTIANTLRAVIENSTVTAGQMVIARATEEAKIITVSLGLAGASNFALGGSIGVNVITNQVDAHISRNSTVQAKLVNVSATDTSTIYMGLGGIAVSGNTAAGAAVGSNSVANTVTAYIDRSSVTATTDDVRVLATSNPTIGGGAIGGAISGFNASVAGSILISTITNRTQAYITDDGTHFVLANGNVIVSALQDLNLNVGTGGFSASGGAAAVGLANATLVTTNIVEAYLGEFATVDAKANANPYPAYTGKKTPQGTLLTENVHGVSVTSTSFQNILSLAVAGSGSAGAGVAGSATVEVLNETSKAYIGRGARINLATQNVNSRQGINLHATNQTRTITGAGGVAGGGTAGFGAGVDVGVLTKTTQAYIADATVSSRSFAASSVDLTTNTIDFKQNHGWTTGQAVVYSNGSGTSISPLGSGDTVYYAIVTSPTTIRLASSRANALLGAGIDLTSAGTSIAQSFQAITDQVGPTVGSSAVTLASDINAIDLGLPHGYTTGQAVVYNANEGPGITGLESGRVYYVIVDSNQPTKLRLASTSANAFAGVAVPLTAQGTAPIQTLTRVDLAASQSLTGATVRLASDANTITTTTPHGLTTGQPVLYRTVDSGALGGLLDRQIYYAIVLSPTKLRLALTAEDAAAGTAIALSESSGAAQSFAPLVFSNRVFNGASVQGQIIDLGYSHGFRTGDLLAYDADTGTAIGGLQSGRAYFAIVDPAQPTRIHLADTLQAARAGQARTLSPGTGLNHSLVQAVAGTRRFNAATQVDIDQDTIDLGYAHGYIVGQAVVYQRGGFPTIGNLVEGQVYYVIPVANEPTKIRLASTPANATSATAWDLTSLPAAPTQTLQVITLAGSTSAFGPDAVDFYSTQQDSIAVTLGPDLLAEPGTPLVRYLNGGGEDIGGLTNNQVYYLIKDAPVSGRVRLSDTPGSGSTPPSSYLGLFSAGTSRSQQFQLIRTGTQSSFSPSSVITEDEASSIFFPTPHGFKTGQLVVYSDDGGTAIGGLVSGRAYYAIVDATRPEQLKLAATLLDQLQGKTIALTSTGGGSFRLATPGLPVPFGPAAVTLSSNLGNTITLPSDHGFSAGQAVVYDNGAGTSIGGLRQGGIYYVILVPGDSRSFRLASSAAAAAAGTAVTLTSRGVGLLHTFRPITLPGSVAGSAPATVRAKDDVRIRAESTEQILSVSIAGAGGFSGPAIAGSIGTWTQVLTTEAIIGEQADVQAGSNVQVSARDMNNLSLLAGSAAFSGSAGIGAAVGVPVVVKSTTAAIRSGAKVDALAGGQELRADTGEFDITFGSPTFNPADATQLDLTQDWITLSYEHGFTPGQAVIYESGGAGTSAIGNLTSGTTYYAITDPNNPYRLRLAATQADATADTPTWIDLTAGAVGSSHSITPVGAVTPNIQNTSVTAPGLYSRRLATPRTTPVRGVIVTAVSTDDVEQMILAGAAAVGVAVPLSGAVHVLDTTTTAFIGQQAQVNRNQASASATQSVHVAAGSDYYHLGVAGAAGGAGGVAVGAGINVTAPTVRSLAYIDQGATVYAANNVAVRAHTEANLIVVTAGFAGGGTVGVGGSVSVAAINTETRAWIGTKDPVAATLTTEVRANNNVLVQATDNASFLAVTGAGGLGIAGAGAGLSLPIAVFTRTTEAYIGNRAIVEGKALGTDTMTVTDDVPPPVPQPFDPRSTSALDTGSDTITLGYDHGFETGQEVFYDSGTGISIGGLATGTTYYAIVTGPRTLKLARTHALALQGTAIDLSLGATTGKQHTLRPDSTFRTRTTRGVAVQARSSEDSLTVAVAGGGGLWAGLAGVVAVTVINSTTRAFVEDADINVPLAGTSAAGSSQSVSVAAVNATRVRTVAPTVAGGAGAFAGVVNVVYVNNRTQAYLGDRSTVNASDDVEVTALSYKDLDIFSISLSGGAVALSAAVSVVTLGAPLTADARTALQDPSNENNTVNNTLNDGSRTDRISSGLADAKADPNASSNVSTRGDQQTTGNSHVVSNYLHQGSTLINNRSGSTAASTIDSTTAPASGTAAFIGKDATVTAGDDVDLHAAETVRLNGSSGGLSGGIAGVGGSVGVITINSNTQAFIDSRSVVSAGDDLDVDADYASSASLLVYTGTGGAAALGAQVGSLEDNSVQQAYLNDRVEVRRADAVRVQATATRSLLTEVGGVSLAGVAVGGSGSTAKAGGSTRAYVGSSAKIGQEPGQTVGSLTVQASHTSTAEARGFLVTAGIGALGISNFIAQITPTVEASIRSGAAITVSTDVRVVATSSAIATVDNRGGGGGGVSVTTLVSNASIGGSTTAWVGEGVTISARDLIIEATAPVRTAKATTYIINISLGGGGGSDTDATVGGATLGGSVSAYVGPVAGTQPGSTPAQLNITRTLAVRSQAVATTETNVTVGVGGLFVAAAGATATTTVETATTAYLGQNTRVGSGTNPAGSVEVEAQSTDLAITDTTVGSGSLFYSLRGMKAEAVLKPTVAAYLGQGVVTRLGGDLDLTARSVRAEGRATAKSYGGGLVDVGAPESTVTSTPKVSAYLAPDSDVRLAGSATIQALGLSAPSSTLGPLTDQIQAIDAGTDRITFPSHNLKTGDLVLYSKGSATTGLQVPNGSGGNRDLPTTLPGPNNTTTERLYRVLVVDDNVLQLGVQVNAEQAINSGDLFARSEGVDLLRNTVQFPIPHNLQTGDAIRYYPGSVGTQSVGLNLATTYYVRKIDDFTIKFYSTRTDAEATGRTFVVDAGADTLEITNHGYQTNDRVTYLAPTPSEFRSTFVNANPQTDAQGNITGFAPQTTPDHTIYLPDHGFNTLDQVIYRTSGTAISNLANNTTYFVIRIDANRFKLAASATDAVSQPGPNNTTIPPRPILIAAAAGSENARHLLVPRPIAGLTSGVTYTVQRVDANKFKLRDSTGTLVEVDAAGTRGAHLILRDGVDLSTGTGIQQFTLDISLASTPAGSDKLLGANGVSLRLLTPPSGTGQSNAFASGESGGGLAFSTPTATVTVTPTILAYLSGDRLSADGDITVLATVVGNLAATAENKGGGFITDNKSTATANFGTGDGKAASHAFIGTRDAEGDISATGVTITAGGNFTLGAHSSLSSTVNASTRGGGFGAGLTAKGYANSNLNTASTVGADAQVAARVLTIESIVESITPSVTVSAVGGGVFGQATGHTNFGITSVADVTVGGGTTTLTGTEGVVIQALHPAFSRTTSPTASFTGIGPSDPKTFDNNSLTAKINAASGATVVAGPSTARTYALSVQAENLSPDVVAPGLGTNQQTIVWDANVTIPRTINPELEINASGQVTRISNLTATSGGTTLDSVGDQVSGNSIVVNDIVDGAASQVYFRAPSSISNSARSPRPVFTMINTYSQVRIVNHSDASLQVDDIRVANTASAPKPQVILSGKKVTDSFEFDIASAVGPTSIIITQDSGATARDLILTGLIDNPIGTTTISNVNGKIVRQGTALIRSNRLTISSTGRVGTEATPLDVELVQSSNPAGTVLTPALSVVSTGSGVHLQLRARQRDGSSSPVTVFVDQISATENIDVTLLPTVRDTLQTGITPGKIRVDLRPDHPTAISGDYANRFPSEDGTTTALDGAIYGTTTNTSTLTGTYDFRNRANPGSAALRAGGNLTLKAASSGVADPLLHLFGLTDLHGDSSTLTAITTGTIDLTSVGTGSLEVATVQSVQASVKLTVPDQVTTGQDLNLLANGKIQAATSVRLLIGDNLSTASGSQIVAGTSINIQTDSNDADSGTGTTLDIKGSLTSKDIDLIGGSDNDSFLLHFANGINAGLSPSVLRVDGSAGTNTLLVSDAGDTLASNGALTGSTVTGLGMGGDGVIYTRMASLEVRLSQGGSAFQVFGTSVPTQLLGGDGNDVITVASQVSGPRDLSTLLAELTIDAAGGNTNQLILDDSGSLVPQTVVVTSNRITGLAPVAIHYAATDGHYTSDPTNAGITLRGSSTAADTFLVRSTLAGSTTKIDSLGGDDLIQVSSDAGTNQGHLDDIQGTLTVDAGAGSNRLILSDLSATTGNSNIVVTDSAITGFAPAAIYYQATGGHFTNGVSNDGILLIGSNTVGDVVHIQSTLSGSTTRIDTRGGSDVLTVVSEAGPSAGNLDGILGTLTIEAGIGFNRLTISDFSAADNASVTLTSNSLVGFAPAPIFYTASGGNFTNGASNDGILLRGSNLGPDTFLVRSTLTGSTTKIDSLGGDDLIQVSSDAGTNQGHLDDIQGTLTVDAGAGSNRLILSDLSATTGNSNIVVTDSAITGFAPVAIHYQATGGHFTNGASKDGILLRGSNVVADTFLVRSTLAGSTLLLEGNGGDDLFHVSSDDGNLGHLDRILGTLTVDGGDGNANHLVVSDYAGTGDNPAITVTDRAITGFAPADIFYYSLTGSFNHSATGDGILLRGSNTGADTFVIASTLRGSTTKIEGNGGADAFHVGSTPTINLGNLNAIQGRLRLEGGAQPAGTRDRITVNDRGYLDAGVPVRANYTLTPNRLDSYAVGAGQFLKDQRLNAPARPLFAGIDYDGSTEFFRLDGTDAVNIFDVKPSLQTEYFIDGNRPVPGTPLFGGGDYLMLDTTGTRGRKLGIRSLGAGTWTFTSGHKLVGFESIERFNHVGLIASTIDPGTANRPIVVRDAETGAVRFTVNVYERNFRGGVQTAIGDFNGDGLPDLLVAPGAGRAPVVQIYSGAPNAAGVVGRPLLASFSAYSGTFRGGVNVAVGDVNRDGRDDLVTVTRGLTLPEVRVFDGRFIQTTRRLIGRPFLADNGNFRGITSLAVGDINRDGHADIVTQRAARGATVIRIFDGRTFATLRTFSAFGQTFQNGGSLAIGDYDGDGWRDLIVGAGSGWLPQVKVFDGQQLLSATAPPVLTSRMATATTFRNGVRIKLAPVNGGNPGFVERIYVMAELPGTSIVRAFSQISTDRHPWPRI